MTRDEITEELAAWEELNGPSQSPLAPVLFAAHIAGLAERDEREACAKVCDAGNDPVLPEKYSEACRVSAALIRARSND
jgi:hypothetical protein